VKIFVVARASSGRPERPAARATKSLWWKGPRAESAPPSAERLAKGRFAVIVNIRRHQKSAEGMVEGIKGSGG